jgi:aminoglycoside 3-N-acetyltransferase I
MTESAPYEVRAIGPGDIDLMRGLLECFGVVFDERDTYCSAQPSDRYLHDLLSGECFFALAAVCDGRVVGGLAGYELRKFEQPRSELYIYDLGVSMAYRRRGIATALIEEARRTARARGAWIVFVQAELGDDPAIALYSKFGSREDAVQFDIPVDGGVQ